MFHIFQKWGKLIFCEYKIYFRMVMEKSSQIIDKNPFEGTNRSGFRHDIILAVSQLQLKLDFHFFLTLYIVLNIVQYYLYNK